MKMAYPLDHRVAVEYPLFTLFSQFLFFEFDELSLVVGILYCDSFK